MKRVVLFVALFFVACSLIVEPGDEQCSGPEGCPMGTTCFEGVCGICANVAESCNGVDDDCDGTIDEEQGIEVCNGLDDDCDGTVDEGLGGSLEVCNGLDDDCDGETDEDVPTMTDVCNDVDDDCDGTVDEGSAETCNNLDDDCDGKTDEEVDENGLLVPLCGADSICAGECTLRSCANDALLDCEEGVTYCNNFVSPPQCDPVPTPTCEDDDDCAPTELCIDEINACRAITPLGMPCRSDDTCVDGTFCADLEAIGRPGSTTCTNTCCDDSDCPPQSHCASTRLGARLCVAESEGAPVQGGCTAHTDCASGYCRIAQGECEAICNSDANCGATEACVFQGAADSTAVTGCYNAGRRDPHDFCTEHSQCRSWLCYGNQCVEPCGAVGECPAGDGCTSVPAAENLRLNFCLVENPAGAAGVSCTVNGQCDSLRCHNGQCVAPCCSNSSCADGRTCQPIQTGDLWPTFCVPTN